MFQGLIRDTVLGVVRHLATTGAGYLAAQGIISGDQKDSVIGSVLFLAGVGWSAYQKWGQHKTVTALKSSITPN